MLRRTILKLPLALAGPAAGLNGTFLQLWAAHLEWPPARWEELFGYLRRLSIREVIVQWSRYQAIDYTGVVERVAGAGFEVWQGLAFDPAWWRNPSPELILDARRVAKIAGVHGFYLPQEIEDGQAGLAKAIHQVRRDFHPLAVSGFTNRKTSPWQNARYWRDLRKAAGFDRLLFQDGIGAGKMPLEEWDRWLAPLWGSVGRALSVVVETFVAGKEAEFHATPAPKARIEEQIRVTRRHGSPPLIAFSAPDYMTPLGGEKAAELFREWTGEEPR